MTALDLRYQASRAEGVARGVDAELTELEAIAAAADVVGSRWIGKVEELASGDSQLYPSYYQLLEGEVQSPASDEWNELRARADATLFPGYFKEIRFGVLSPDGAGAPGYGDCDITFRRAMIAHRTTFYEENSLLFADRVLMAGRSGVTLPRPIREDLPRGYRARWQDVGRLAVTKLGHKVSAGATADDLRGLLLEPGVRAVEHQFIEAHIYGSMTRRTMERVRIRAEMRRGRTARERQLQERLESIGVEVEFIR